MAKKKEKFTQEKAEKLGEIVGRRRPFLGAALLFFGVIFLVALFDFRIGQEVFFKESMASFMDSTKSAGTNLCGALGATFCVLALLLIGWSAWLIPLYLIWTGLMCFKRRKRPVDLVSLIAMVLSVVAFSAMGSMLQNVKGADGVTAYFLSGWGGKLGMFIFDGLLFPTIEIFGSAILLLCVYVACLIVILFDNPASAAVELKDSAKRVPHFIPGILGRLWYAFSYIPRAVFAYRRSKRDAAPTGERVDIIGSASPSNGNASLRDLALDAPQGEESAPAQAAQKKGGFFGIFAKKNGERKTPEEEIAQEKPLGARALLNADTIPEEQDDLEFKLVNSSGEALEEPAEDADDGGEEDEVVPPRFEDEEGDDEESEPVETSASRAEGLKIERTTVELVDDLDMATPKRKGDYVFPPLDLLPDAKPPADVEDYEARMNEIIATFETFKIRVTRASVSPGPVITRYEVYPESGVKISKIAGLENDIALGLRALSVRIIAPVPGKGTVGIEVPNRVRENVMLKDIMLSKAWAESKAEIPVVLGKDVTGVPKVLDLTKMPHALVAGATASGKSVCINGIINSLLFKFTPDDLRLIMVDPKVVELRVYNDLPHMLIPVVTDPRKVLPALKWLAEEMKRRYDIFAAAKVRNIAGFNAKILQDKEEQKKAEELSAAMTANENAATAEAAREVDASEVEIPQQKLPYIICIIDELADVMLIAGKEVEIVVMRLTALARAAGIHLIVATQRPSADIVTGPIKANLPTRISFKVSSLVDSRTILDAKGAETLIGMGDMLFIPPGSSDLVRAQGAFLGDKEINDIVEFLKEHNGPPEYEEDIQSQIDASLEDDDGDGGDAGEGDGSDEDFINRAIDVIKRHKKASTSFLQRKMGIGYNKAARIMDSLEDRGYIGPDNGPGKPRDINL